MVDPNPLPDKPLEQNHLPAPDDAHTGDGASFASPEADQTGAEEHEAVESDAVESDAVADDHEVSESHQDPGEPQPTAAPEVADNKQWYVVKVQSGREKSIRDAIVRKVKIEGLEE